MAPDPTLANLADGHHVERLRQNLWSGQIHGRAAVLVGAGMSANAEALNPSSGPMPMFGEIALRMWRELNPFRTSEPPPHLDPIELASDYEGVFQREALNDFLRRELNDAGYRPTRIHRLLMSLPWADVYTTNYDTLLERAAATVVDRRYAIAATVDSLVGSQRPRIVKVHGSFPDRLPFIITKEDFRQYPRTHATFVNTVQQAIMECSLCLLGFGGTDPNFLAWAGWVNDNLGRSAPPIYLAGVLDLDPRYRSILERRRVVPIDLGPIFPRSQYPDVPTRHRAANEWLLLNLAHGDRNPVSWPIMRSRTASGLHEFRTSEFAHMPGMEQKDNESGLESFITIMNQYPGWLTCPEDQRTLLQVQLQSNGKALHDALIKDDVTDATSSTLRIWGAYIEAIELMRDSSSREGHERLQVFLQGCENDSAEWFSLALRNMTMLRWNDQWEHHIQWQQRLEKKTSLTELQRARLHHEVALRHLDRLDYSALQDSIRDWVALPGAFRIEMAHAALLVELSETDRAIRIVGDVLAAIRAGTPSSGPGIGALAIEGAAMTFLQIVSLEAKEEDTAKITGPRGRMAELERWNCNPSSYFESAEKELLQSPRKNSEIVKSFDVGSLRIQHNRFARQTPQAKYRDNALIALRLFEALCLPFRCGSSVYFLDIALLAARAIANTNPERACALLLRARASKELGEICNSLYIARLDEANCRALRDLCFRVIDARSTKQTLRADCGEDEYQLAAALELLSRLVTRFDEKTVVSVFNLATDLVMRPGIFEQMALSEAIRNCVLRTYNALPESTQLGLIDRLLEMPMAPVRSAALSTRSWSEPLLQLKLPKAPPESRPKWARAIQMLILDVQLGSSETRWSALRRLVMLHLSGNLSEDQSRQFGEALWSKIDANQLPEYFLSSTFSFYPAVLLSLPGVPNQAFTNHLRTWLLKELFPSTDGVMGSQRDKAENQARAAFAWLSDFFARMNEPLSSEEACAILQRAAKWLQAHQSRQYHDQHLDASAEYNDTLLEGFVSFLADHVLPVISIGDAQAIVHLQEIMAALSKEPVSSLDLVYELTRLGLEDSRDAVSRTLTGIRSGAYSNIISAASGVRRWHMRDDAAPSELLREVIYFIHRPGHRAFSAVVYQLARLLEAKLEKLNSSDVDRIVSATAAFELETDLSNIETDDLYDDPSWKLDSRVAASRLAAILWMRSERHRDSLEAWRAAADKDLHGEVRTAWRVVVGDRAQ